jgi:MFS transporter, DHA1 family, inner membrane transport protein
MKFFSNSAINRLYAHAGLQSFAFNSGSVFSYVFLVKAGISVPVVFCIIAAVILLRLALRPLLLPIVIKFGLRNGLILGTLLDASSFLLLGQVEDLGAWLVGYMVVSSCGTAFYWTSYHASVTEAGDAEHRGSQVSVREALVAITGIVAPLFGGIMLTVFGPVHAFAATFLIYSSAALPILSVPRMMIVRDGVAALGARRFAFGLAFSDGLVAAAGNFVWRIVLFQTLGESFNTYGGALAIAGVAGAVIGLVAGRLIDLGHHKWSLQIGVALMVGTVLAQVLGFAAPWSAVGANMLWAVAGPLYMSAIMAPLYNVGQKSGCSYRFNVAAENGFDCGSGLGVLAAAGIVWAGFGYSAVLAIGLLGCAGVYAILRGRDGAGVKLVK